MCHHLAQKKISRGALELDVMSQKKTQILVLGSLLCVGGTMGAVRRAGAWVFHPLRKAAGQGKQTDKLFSASSKKKLFSACVSANVLNWLNKYFSYTLDEGGKQKERTCSIISLLNSKNNSANV